MNKLIFIVSLYSNVYASAFLGSSNLDSDLQSLSDRCDKVVLTEARKIGGGQDGTDCSCSLYTNTNTYSLDFRKDAYTSEQLDNPGYILDNDHYDPEWDGYKYEYTCVQTSEGQERLHTKFYKNIPDQTSLSREFCSGLRTRTVGESRAGLDAEERGICYYNVQESDFEAKKREVLDVYLASIQEDEETASSVSVVRQAAPRTIEQGSYSRCRNAVWAEDTFPDDHRYSKRIFSGPSFCSGSGNADKKTSICSAYVVCNPSSDNSFIRRATCSSNLCSNGGDSSAQQCSSQGGYSSRDDEGQKYENTFEIPTSTESGAAR